MAIVKRLTPEGKLLARMGETWRQILCAPIVAALCNPHFEYYVDATPEALTALTSKFYDKNWMTKVTWNEKVFLYVAGMVARRAGVPGFLPEEHLTQLGRHMNAASTIDKIDHNEVSVSLTARMTIVFYLPEFLEKHTKPGSYKLPPYAPPKPRRPDSYLLMSYEQRKAYDKANAPKPVYKKLAKHRKGKLQSIAS